MIGMSFSSTEYGTTTSYGAATPSTDAGSGTGDVAASAPLSGLAPSTTYHFRLVASNAVGSTPGADGVFTTAAAAGDGGTPPLAPTPPPPSPPPPKPSPKPKVALKLRGRTLTREADTGRLRVSMTETRSGEPKSYAVIAMDDAESIRASSSAWRTISWSSTASSRCLPAG